MFELNPKFELSSHEKRNERQNKEVLKLTGDKEKDRISIMESYIKKARNHPVHRTYDYSKVVDTFVDRSSKVEVICPEHGSFFTNMKDHIKTFTDYRCITCKQCKEEYKRYHTDKQWYRYDVNSKARYKEVDFTEELVGETITAIDPKEDRIVVCSVTECLCLDHLRKQGFRGNDVTVWSETADYKHPVIKWEDYDSKIRDVRWFSFIPDLCIHPKKVFITVHKIDHMYHVDRYKHEIYNYMKENGMMSSYHKKMRDTIYKRGYVYQMWFVFKDHKIIKMM